MAAACAAGCGLHRGERGRARSRRSDPLSQRQGIARRADRRASRDPARRDRRSERGAHVAARADADRRPTGAAARRVRRLPARGRGAPAGRGDAAPRRGDLLRDVRRAAAGAAVARRDPAARHDPERDARAARRGPAARAPLRRRREPRAADAAVAPPGRSSSSRCGARGRPRSTRPRSGRSRRRSTGSCAWPRACSCSPPRRRPGSSRSASRSASCSRASPAGSGTTAPSSSTTRWARWRPTAQARGGAGNLVENAFRHGSPPVRLAAAREGDRAVFRVTDAGPGFPPDFLEHAFERFARADEARTEKGAGLGLAIAAAVAAPTAARRPPGTFPAAAPR